MFQLLITGDFVIQKPYEVSQIDEKLIRLFENSDFNIVNLEAPVTSSHSKLPKTGPNLKSHKESTKKILEALRINLVTLANNHILDYDKKGVSDTLTFCKEQGINSVGAGMNLNEASINFFIDTEEGKIAIVNFAENEWANATDHSAGANPMDLIDNFNQIQRANEQADFVIVIVHGGHEYFNLPSPRMQKQYRFYVDQGADLVVGHHTHCISGYEIYKKAPIFYSLGNFLFTKESSYSDWYQGMILNVTFQKGELSAEYIPVKQTKDDFNLQSLSKEEEENLRMRVEKYNGIIENSESLNHEWSAFVDKQSSNYLYSWSVKSFIPWRYFNAVFNKLNIELINKRGLMNYLNYMRCEAHHDLSKEVITKYLNK